MIKSKPTLRITLSLLFSIGVVVFLYVSADSHRNYRYAAFDRSFHTYFLGDLYGALDIRFRAYYMAGQTAHTLYLGNTQALAHVLQVNSSLTDTTFHVIHADSFMYRSALIQVDSPAFYIADGTQPLLYQGQVTDWQARPRPLDDARFYQARILSPSSIAMTTVYHGATVLAKKLQGMQTPVYFPDLLSSHHSESLFSTDGHLLYDPPQARLVYVYGYKNEYLVMDTSLQVLRTGHTIDTISHPQLTVGETEHSREIEQALVVNNKSFIYGQHLYVYSNLLAANEAIEHFENNTVIDVYDLNNAHYLYSFYLPRYQEQKVHAFVLFEHKLVALYDTYLVGYAWEEKIRYF